MVAEAVKVEISKFPPWSRGDAKCGLQNLCNILLQWLFLLTVFVKRTICVRNMTDFVWFVHLGLCFPQKLAFRGQLPTLKLQGQRPPWFAVETWNFSRRDFKCWAFRREVAPRNPSLNQILIWHWKASIERGVKVPTSWFEWIVHLATVNHWANSSSGYQLTLTSVIGLVIFHNMSHQVV